MVGELAGIELGNSSTLRATEAGRVTPGPQCQLGIAAGMVSSICRVVRLAADDFRTAWRRER